MTGRGFTLLEVLIVVGVAATASAILIAILVQNNRYFYKQTTSISGGLSLNDSLMAIKGLISNSSGIISGYPINGPTYLSGESTLALALPAYNSSGDAISDIYDYAVVVADPQKENVLKLKIFPDVMSSRKAEDKVLTSRLLAVRFFYLDASGVEVSPSQAVKVNFIINLAETVGSNVYESSASSQASLKND